MNSQSPSQALVWGTATMMVTIVSCCSLIGVSIMPLISGPSYKIFITLFTGLAVGSLLGSSIFSLIPQAFNLHLKPDKDYLWKSLIIFLGIYLFYFSERLMRIHFDRRARQQEKQQQLQLTTKKNNTNSNNKSSNSLSNNGDDSNEKLKTQNASSDSNKQTRGDNNVAGTTSDSATNKETMMEISLTNRQDNEEDEIQVHHHHHHHHHHHLNPQQVLTKALRGETAEQPQAAKGPLARRKGDIAPVAWMIIIGDGLHNFIDGLTIGAAFSQSIWLGINTSIAVIFEEFPHELGDFAVLISSGMTVRQALGFNFLSACTCYIGMIFGIVLGDMTQSASYIFALAGGMFLYISLVDMMGELSAMLEESKGSTRETIRLLFMQNVGILSGIIIIFILSLYSQ